MTWYPEDNFREFVSESVSHSASETDRERERMVLKIIKHYDMFYPCIFSLNRKNLNQKQFCTENLIWQSDTQRQHSCRCIASLIRTSVTKPVLFGVFFLCFIDNFYGICISRNAFSLPSNWLRTIFIGTIQVKNSNWEFPNRNNNKLHHFDDNKDKRTMRWVWQKNLLIDERGCL